MFQVSSTSKFLMAFALTFLCIPRITRAKDLEIKGSSTIYPICKAASKAYYAKSKKVVLCEGGGSANGIKFALAGGLGSVSRSLTDEELSKGLHQKAIGRDALAFLVHKDNQMNDLTIEDLKKIFSGKITEWSELNKNFKGKIEILGPNSDHGTYDSLISFLDLKKKAPPGKASPSEEILLTKNYTGFMSHNESIFRAEKNQNTIAVVPLGFWTDYVHKNKKNLHALSINKTKPSSENIVNSTYPSSRLLHLVWVGDLSAEAKEFIEFLKSSEGQKITTEQGFTAETGDH